MGKDESKKTQKIYLDGTKDKEARKIILGYEKAQFILERISDPISPLKSFLLRRRLRSLVQREFRLYKNITKNKNQLIVASPLQEKLLYASKIVNNKLDILVRDSLVNEKFRKKIYKYKIKPAKPNRKR